MLQGAAGRDGEPGAAGPDTLPFSRTVCAPCPPVSLCVRERDVCRLSNGLAVGAYRTNRATANWPPLYYHTDIQASTHARTHAGAPHTQRPDASSPVVPVVLAVGHAKGQVARHRGIIMAARGVGSATNRKSRPRVPVPVAAHRVSAPVPRWLHTTNYTKSEVVYRRCNHLALSVKAGGGKGSGPVGFWRLRAHVLWLRARCWVPCCSCSNVTCAF
jgi:hypothetical protein